IGADRQVMSLVMKEAAVLVAIGVAIGAVCSLVFARTASTLLFGLKAYDPLAFTSAAILLAAVAARGSFLPARRATRTGSYECPAIRLKELIAFLARDDDLKIVWCEDHDPHLTAAA